MNETTKIRDIAVKYCEGCGIDIGCGDEKIRPEALGIDAGTDLVHEGAQESRDLSCVNLKMMVSDLHMFQDNALDYAYSSHFLEHLDDPLLMLSEMIRVVRPGGHVLIYLPDREKYTAPNPEHKNMWTLDEFLMSAPKNVDVVEQIADHSDYGFFVAFKKKES